MANSTGLGLITEEWNITLVCVFTEPVIGLTAQDFTITGPSGIAATNLQMLPNTLTYYSFDINLGQYYGNVTVSFTVRSSSLLVYACMTHVPCPVRKLIPYAFLSHDQIHVYTDVSI